MDQVVDLFGVGQGNVARLFQGGNELSQIEEGLFLGSIGDATNKDRLKNSYVSHILTVAVALEPAYPNDFCYKVIEVIDREETNLMQYFDECINFIDQAKSSGGGVLVHCFMGVSRSVTIVVAYLMKKHGMSMSAALEHVKSRRPQASPNSGFISQLQLYEKSLKAGKEARTGVDNSPSPSSHKDEKKG